MHLLRTCIIWLWLTNLLIATTGVSLQTVYCFCVGERQVAWFNAPDTHCGETETDENDACKQRDNTQDCCRSTKTALPLTDDCTHTSTQYFLLKSDFQGPQLAEWSFEPHWDIAPPGCFIIEDCTLVSAAPADQPFFNHVFFAQPPPSGWERCILHGVIRC
jgi:hypothetical protein